MNETAWLLVPAAALIAVAATPLVRRFALASGVVDRPGPRRSHVGTVPRGGGLAIALAALPAVLIGSTSSTTAWVFVLGGVLVVTLGWIDDRRPQPASLRLVVQAVVAFAAVAALGPVDSIVVAGTEIHGVWIWSALAVIAMVWLMNLFNFMDGSDGLAATQSVSSGTLFAFAFALGGEPALALMAAVLAAAAAGFLVWNWPGARIFLGDSGSLLLGWGAGVLALAGTLSGSIGVGLAFIIVSPFVVDATLTLGWRVLRGERWYTPHRDHAYQYLIRSGWDHRRVLLAWIGLNGLVVAPAALLVTWNTALDLAVSALVAVLLTGGWYVVHFVIHKEDAAT